MSYPQGVGEKGFQRGATISQQAKVYYDEGPECWVCELRGNQPESLVGCHRFPTEDEALSAAARYFLTRACAARERDRIGHTIFPPGNQEPED